MDALKDGGASALTKQSSDVTEGVATELGGTLVDAIECLVNAVEGIGGAMNYGTFKSERGGFRLKDTKEWVSFYVAWSRSKRTALSTDPSVAEKSALSTPSLNTSSLPQSSSTSRIEDLEEALRLHDEFMSEQFRDGPNSSALHPKAAENWNRVRAALDQGSAT